MRAKKNSRVRLADNLKFLKDSGKKNMRQIARDIEIPASTLAAWKDGAVATDHESLLKLSQLLGISLEELLFGDLSKQKAKAADFFQDDVFEGKFIVELKVKRLKQE